jgi:hypothetical protein
MDTKLSRENSRISLRIELLLSLLLLLLLLLPLLKLLVVLRFGLNSGSPVSCCQRFKQSISRH